MVRGLDLEGMVEKGVVNAVCFWSARTLSAGLRKEGETFFGVVEEVSENLWLRAPSQN